VEIGFTPRQVTRLTGVPYSTLNLWAKTGLLRPSISAGVGSGNERVYAFGDLVALKVAFELRKSGVTTRSMKKVIEFVRSSEGFEKPLSEARLIVSGKDVLIVRGGRQLVSALSKPGQGCLSFVVDLPRTLGELGDAADTTRAFAVGLLQPRKPAIVSSKKAPRSVAVEIQQRKRKQHS
jgi:DNA-binding transcriptional MerR regulator